MWAAETCGPIVGDQGDKASFGGHIPRWKRVLDLSFLLFLGIGAVVVGAIVAVVIKLGSRGPIFFRQFRVGYKGREFVCYKFRTMHEGAETDSHRQLTRRLIGSGGAMVKLDARRDPRLIPLGALLRAGGLDELPQLFNVLRGEMSLVGPRPCIPYECDSYQPWHRHRFDVVPGLTGLWQVSGKNRTTFDEMVQLDIAYAQNLSLGLDLKIIARTPWALVSQYLDLRAAKGRGEEASNTERESEFSATAQQL